MGEALTVFRHEQFGEIRAVEINGEPWFVGKDICDYFGDTNYRRSISRLAPDERGVSQIETPGGTQDMTIISESGLYSLLFLMKPKKAKGVSQNDARIQERVEKVDSFKRWVTHEVLPSIRKTGGYVNDEELFVRTYLPFADEGTKALFSSTLTALREANRKIEADKPKVLFADAVSAANTSILVGELAKLLRQNGVQIGQNRLFDFLRDKGYLIRRRGSDYNLPTQRAMEMKLFEIKETVINQPDGSIRVSKTTKVTGKGQQYFVNLFLKGGADNED